MKKVMIITACAILCATGNAFASWGQSNRRDIDPILWNLMEKNKGNIVVYNASQQPSGVTESGKKYAYLSNLSVSRTINPISSTLAPGESTTFIRLSEGVKLQFGFYDLKSNPNKTKTTEKYVATKKSYIFNTAFINNTILATALKNNPGYWDTSTLGLAFYRTSATQSGNDNHIVIYDAKGQFITSLNLERPADPAAAK